MATHPLDGCILPGITRDAIIKLSPKYFPDIKLSERPINIKEFIERHEKGEVLESFMSGTAAIITPVDVLTIRGNDYRFDKGANRDYSAKML